METDKTLQNDLELCDDMLLRLLSLRFDLVRQMTANALENNEPVSRLDNSQAAWKRFEQNFAGRLDLESILSAHQDIVRHSRRAQAQEILGINLFLTGFMGAGKSTAAKALEKRFGLEPVEMDQLIAQKNGMSIPEIFEQYGEPYFRTQETELLRSCTVKNNQIISCGGGVVMRPENVEEMKKSGLVILLKARPETILERVRDSHERPLLENNKTIEQISALMAAREPAYQAAADLIISTDGRTEEEICEEIIAGVYAWRQAAAQTAEQPERILS